MAAYAALISVMNIIEQIQLHPHPPISLDQFQIEPLVKNVTFFLDFLEFYSQLIISSKDTYHLLESRIANATYAVQDILESHIVDQIHGANIASDKEFYDGLKEVIQEMDFIKKEVMQMKENNNMGLFLHKDSSTAVDIGPLRSRLTGQNATVGFDDVMEEMMDMLTGRQSTRQIIPIVEICSVRGDGKVRKKAAPHLDNDEGRTPQPHCGRHSSITPSSDFHSNSDLHRCCRLISSMPRF